MASTRAYLEMICSLTGNAAWIIRGLLAKLSRVVLATNIFIFGDRERNIRAAASPH